jgi:orotidine-5'-phosphate decarboxylase
MTNFADRLIDAIRAKGNPCVIGLDPRVEWMPQYVTGRLERHYSDDLMRTSIAHFHRDVLDVVSRLVPAVKLQIAFYEQYGIPGLLAFQDTIALARERGLVVLVDAKRNDIASTAEAYAQSLLGRVSVFNQRLAPFQFRWCGGWCNVSIGGPSSAACVAKSGHSGAGLRNTGWRRYWCGGELQ